MPFIKTKERNPQETGKYKVKTTNGRGSAYFIENSKGELIWVGAYDVVEWEEKLN